MKAQCLLHSKCSVNVNVHYSFFRWNERESLGKRGRLTSSSESSGSAREWAGGFHQPPRLSRRPRAAPSWSRAGGSVEFEGSSNDVFKALMQTSRFPQSIAWSQGWYADLEDQMVAKWIVQDLSRQRLFPNVTLVLTGESSGSEVWACVQRTCMFKKTFLGNSSVHKWF